MGGSGSGLDPYADGEPRPPDYRCPSCKVEIRRGAEATHMAGCRYVLPGMMLFPPPEKDV